MRFERIGHSKKRKDLERPFCCREKKSKTHENNQMIILIRRIMSRPTCCMLKGFKFQALTLLTACSSAAHVASAVCLQPLGQHGGYKRGVWTVWGRPQRRGGRGGTCWRDAATTGKSVPAAPGSTEQHSAASLPPCCTPACALNTFSCCGYTVSSH